MKCKKVIKETDNSREYKMFKKKIDLKCSLCPPHKMENASRRVKHGSKKPRYKDPRA